MLTVQIIFICSKSMANVVHPIFLWNPIFKRTICTCRASAEEMRQAAAADANIPPPTANRQNSMHSNLVANAQPISFTGSPIYDSNV